MIREGLHELAIDLRGSSSASADELWSKVEPTLWEHTRNPWLLIHLLSDQRIEALREDDAFVALLNTHLEERKAFLEAPGWFQLTHPKHSLKGVAYFSMEFGLSEGLPIYSGGLGVLAGDHLKAASDLGIPLVGVGILFQEGYFRQSFNKEGEQIELYPHNDPVQLPICRACDAAGHPIRISVEFPGRDVWLRVWQVQVGRVVLYLLDSNDLLNTPTDRGITSQLYGGGSEVRLQQEMLLGIGGWRLLSVLGLDIQVLHLNEGHAALAAIERAKAWSKKQELTFHEALEATKYANVFTTHTPVPAGFDRFEPALVKHYLRTYTEDLNIGAEGLLALGRENAKDTHEPLNMAFLAVRASGTVNGVSRLHCEVTCSLLAGVASEASIGYVTNGVHLPSWESAEADRLWTASCGVERWLGTMESVHDCIRHVSDEQLWEFCSRGRQRLIDYARLRLARQMEVAGASQEEVCGARSIFDPQVLTLGFARRFASYKRPNLLLHDSDRLLRLLTDSDRPVQLVIAGKAHPDDAEGKALIKEWNSFISQTEVRPHVIFLADYDILVAERLVQGVDVWVNTPRRPSEASGTSGMKTLVNGGLNLSVTDGWWAEAYTPHVGWGIEADNDAAEAEQFYQLLEERVVPTFYERDARGIPARWLALVRESMATLTAQYSTNRMVREYTERYYIPGAKRMPSD